MAESGGVDLSQIGGTEVPEASTLRQLINPEEAVQLEPGTHFVDEHGEHRIKPYQPKKPEDVYNLPEGAPFTDPDGNLRYAPTYKSIGVSAQSLYDMAVTDEEREHILKRHYPGKNVTKYGDRFVVDDNGELRSPGHGAAAVVGDLVASAAPAIGAGGGAALGAGAGIFTGPGAIATGAMGATAGAMLGQGFNDALLALMGDYSRSAGREVANVAGAGLAGLGGEALGAAAAGGGSLMKEGAKNLAARPWATAAARKFLGATDPGKTQMAADIATEAEQKFGIEDSFVRISAHSFHVPHLTNLAEVFDAAFHQENPYRLNAEKYYRGKAKEVLDSVGATPLTDLVNPESAVSVRKPGELALTEARSRLAAADAQLESAFRQEALERMTGVAVGQEARESVLQNRLSDANKAAKKVVDGLFEDINGDVDNAVKAVDSDLRSGDLWRQVGAKIREVKRAGQARFQRYYDAVEHIAGDIEVPIGRLSFVAQSLLKQLPPEFQQQYPGLVQRLSKLLPKRNEKGQYVGAPTMPWVQLRNLRSWIRANVRDFDLAADVWGGSYKYMGQLIDTAVNTVPKGLNATQAKTLKKAQNLLAMVDDHYADFIGPFTTNRIRAVIKALKGGMPADGERLYNTIFPDASADTIVRIQNIIGPQLSQAVKAADLRAILQHSRSPVEGLIDGRSFVNEVMRRHKADLLEAIHGPEVTKKLLRQVQNLERLSGRLDIPIEPDDTMSTIMERAVQAKEALEAHAKRDPIQLLERERKAIEREQRMMRSDVARQRKGEPLGFLYDPRQGAIDAADTILKDPDLLFASADYFGHDSETFKELQKAYVLRLLQGSIDPGRQLPSIAPEVQALMMPGYTHDMVVNLGRVMKFVLDTPGARRSVGAAMAAQSRVNHPVSSLPLLRGGAKMLGMDMPARMALSESYALIRRLTSSPALLRWLANNANSRNPQARAAAINLIKKQLRAGGAFGASVAEELEQQIEGGGDEETETR